MDLNFDMINVSIVTLFLLLFYLSTTAGLQCLSCRNVPDKRDCRRLLTCGTNQMCYANRVIDGTKTPMYNLGCEDQFACSQHPQSVVGKREMDFEYSDFTLSKFGQKRTVQTTCFQCCNNTNGCNINACGAVTTTNRRCYSCSDVVKKEDCDQITECSREMYCYVHEGVNKNIASYESRYDFGCMGQKQCSAFKLINPQSCVACCNQTDLCNYDACDNWTPAVTPSRLPPTTPTTTQTTTTTTTTLPTTPPPKVIINGPDKEKYMIQTQLTCVTEPPAQSYRWKFNGTANLPTGITTQQVGSQAGSVAGKDTLHIANLTVAQLGTYTCVATINGQTVERSHFLGIIGEKPTVHIEKPPVSQNFAMQCQVTGYPVPHIDWDFVPDAMGAHGIPQGVQFLHEAYQSTLFVKTYSPVEHTGEWYCKASNLLGSALTHVHIP